MQKPTHTIPNNPDSQTVTHQLVLPAKDLRVLLHRQEPGAKSTTDEWLTDKDPSVKGSPVPPNVDIPNAEYRWPKFGLEPRLLLEGVDHTAQCRFHWVITCAWNYKTRPGPKLGTLTATIAPFDTQANTTTTIAWPGGDVHGGVMLVTLVAFYDQVSSTTDPYATTKRYLRITGQNPTQDEVNQYFKELQSSPTYPRTDAALNALFWDAYQRIWKQESNLAQFDARSPSTVDPNYLRKGFPVYGPPGGYGIGQIDPESGPSTTPVMWSWRENMKGGAHVLVDKLSAAENYSASQHKKTKVPPMTNAQLVREAVRRYNGLGDIGSPEFGVQSGQWVVNDRSAQTKGDAKYTNEVLGPWSP